MPDRDDRMFLPLPSHVRALIGRLADAGYETLAVGGAVRDLLMGREPSDWDLATAAPPDAVMALFADHRLVTQGLRFGTVTVIAAGKAVEITTYRRESGYADGRHPDAVRYVGSFEEDAARRDFTVNAMGYADAVGLCDPHGGRADLLSRVIRCVGDPKKRFSEDALRVLRAIRFAAVLDFSVEEATAAAMTEAAPTVAKVSPGRRWPEIKKWLSAPPSALGRVIAAYPEVSAAALELPRERLDLFAAALAAHSTEKGDAAAALTLLLAGDDRETVKGFFDRWQAERSLRRRVMENLNHKK